MFSNRYKEGVARYGFHHNKLQKKDLKFKNIKTINNQILHKPLTGRGSCERNLFFKNTLRAMGGSEERAIKLYESFGRYGGGRTDSIIYMKNFDKPCDTDPPSLYSDDEWCRRIFGVCHDISLPSIWMSVEEPDVPSDTSPGITYKRMGFYKKADAMPVCQHYLRELLSYLEHNDPEADTQLLWCTAGRPKFMERDKAFRKVMERSSVGRSVWVSDMEEAILARHFTRHVSKKYMGSPGSHKIMINFDKVQDASKLKSWVSKYDGLIEADYSKFDSSVPREVVIKAFDIFKCLFGPMTLLEERIYKMLKTNFLNSYVDIGDGRLFKKNSGIPSGSGFTSIIGSISNFIMLDEAFSVIGLPEGSWDAIVYGDDCLIGLKQLEGDKAISFFKIKKWLIEIMRIKYGIKLDKKDTKVVTDKYVKIVVPIYEGDTSRGTSQMKPVGYSYYYEEPDSNIISNSSSHRWWYSFKSTWKFLGFSMLKSGKLIRPTLEVLARIYNPERPIKNWDEHITSLKMAYLENYDNAHTRNRVFHYMLDAWWVLNNGCPLKEIPDVFETVLRGRCWYRYVDYIVDLPTSPQISKFTDYFLQFDTKMFSLHQSIRFNESYYANIKRGRLSMSLYDLQIRPHHYTAVTKFCSKMGLETPHKIYSYKFCSDWFRSHPQYYKITSWFLSHRFSFYSGRCKRKKKKKILKLHNMIQASFRFLYPPKKLTINNIDLLSVTYIKLE